MPNTWRYLVKEHFKVFFGSELFGATSRSVHLEKFSLNFSSSSFVIRANLLNL